MVPYKNDEERRRYEEREAYRLESMASDSIRGPNGTVEKMLPRIYEEHSVMASFFQGYNRKLDPSLYGEQSRMYSPESVRQTLWQSYQGWHKEVNRLFLRDISIKGEWVLNNLFPTVSAQVAEEGLGIRFGGDSMYTIRWIFESMVNGSKPRCAPGRIATSRKESNRTPMQYSGGGFIVPLDFMQTPEGRNAFKMHFNQMTLDTQNTLCFQILQNLTNEAIRQREVRIREEMTFPMNDRDFENMVASHNNHAFALNKTGGVGYDGLLEEHYTALDQIGHAPTTVICSSGCMRLTDLVNPERRVLGKIGNGETPIVQSHLTEGERRTRHFNMRAYASRAYMLETRKRVDPTVTILAAPERFVMCPRGGSGDLLSYKSRHRNIRFRNGESGDLYTLELQKAIDNFGIWDPETGEQQMLGEHVLDLILDEAKVRAESYSSDSDSDSDGGGSGRRRGDKKSRDAYGGGDGVSTKVYWARDFYAAAGIRAEVDRLLSQMSEADFRALESIATGGGKRRRGGRGQGKRSGGGSSILEALTGGSRKRARLSSDVKGASSAGARLEVGYQKVEIPGLVSGETYGVYYPIDAAGSNDDGKQGNRQQIILDVNRLAPTVLNGYTGGEDVMRGADTARNWEVMIFTQYVKNQQGGTGEDINALIATANKADTELEGVERRLARFLNASRLNSPARLEGKAGMQAWEKYIKDAATRPGGPRAPFDAGSTVSNPVWTIVMIAANGAGSLSTESGANTLAALDSAGINNVTAAALADTATFVLANAGAPVGNPGYGSAAFARALLSALTQDPDPAVAVNVVRIINNAGSVNNLEAQEDVKFGAVLTNVQIKQIRDEANGASPVSTTVVPAGTNGRISSQRIDNLWRVAKLTYAFVSACVRLDIPVPFSCVIFRPYATFLTASMTFLNPNVETGVNVLKDLKVNFGPDMDTQEVRVDTHMTLGTLIRDPRRISIEPHAAGLAYLSGAGVKFFRPNYSTREHYKAASEFPDHDMFVCAVPYNHEPRSSMLTDMTGFVSTRLKRKTERDERPAYATAPAYASYWGWTHKNSNNTLFTAERVRNFVRKAHTICCQGTQQVYQPGSTDGLRDLIGGMSAIQDNGKTDPYAPLKSRGFEYVGRGIESSTPNGPMLG